MYIIILLFNPNYKLILAMKCEFKNLDLCFQILCMMTKYTVGLWQLSKANLFQDL